MRRSVLSWSICSTYLFLHLPHGMVHGRAGGTGHRHKFLIGFPAFLSAGGIVFVSWYTKLPLNHADMPRLKFYKEALALATRAAKVNHRAAFQDVCLEKGRRITDRRTHVGFCGAGSEIAQVCPECAGVVFIMARIAAGRRFVAFCRWRRSSIMRFPAVLRSYRSFYFCSICFRVSLAVVLITTFSAAGVLSASTPRARATCSSSMESVVLEAS